MHPIRRPQPCLCQRCCCPVSPAAGRRRPAPAPPASLPRGHSPAHRPSAAVHPPSVCPLDPPCALCLPSTSTLLCSSRLHPSRTSPPPPSRTSPPRPLGPQPRTPCPQPTACAAASSAPCTPAPPLHQTCPVPPAQLHLACWHSCCCSDSPRPGTCSLQSPPAAAVPSPCPSTSSRTLRSPCTHSTRLQAKLTACPLRLEPGSPAPELGSPADAASPAPCLAKQHRHVPGCQRAPSPSASLGTPHAGCPCSPHCAHGPGHIPVSVSRSPFPKLESTGTAWEFIWLLVPPLL